jgi:glycosyltransferase involved in cell wall biosynthesis
MPPYFVFPHGMLDPWFQNAPGRRLKSLRNSIYWKLVESKVIRDASGILFTCAEEMRLARDTFRHYEPRRQIAVGLGTPRPPKFQFEMAEAFAEKCPGLGKNPYFLFLGRIDSKKGVDLLIDAYAELCRSVSEPQRQLLPRLVMAGPETPFGSEMKARAAKNCPPEHVCWPGMLEGSAKWGALYRAEAFVLPSHQENFGIAVVEALACGKPVLISDRINIWREIETDAAGFVAEDTVGGARDLFRRWLNLSSEAKIAMSLAAERSYEGRFAIELAAKNLLSAIESMTPHTRSQPVRQSIQPVA